MAHFHHFPRLADIFFYSSVEPSNITELNPSRNACTPIQNAARDRDLTPPEWHGARFKFHGFDQGIQRDIFKMYFAMLIINGERSCLAAVNSARKSVSPAH